MQKPEYIQVGKPNGEELRRLILEVKGDRSMADFADDIRRSSPGVRVSAPTLSRACRADQTSPVSFDLLVAIAKVAPSNSDMILKKLAQANGMRSASEDEELTQTTEAVRRRAYEADSRHVRMILQNEIATRGFSSQQLKGDFSGRFLNGYGMQSDRVFPRNYTFGFYVSGMAPCSTWKFMLNQYEMPESVSDKVIEAYVGNYINRVGAIFAGDSFESDLYEGEKYYFVFVTRKTYELFLKRLTDHGIQVNGLMTAILVDLNVGRVVEETQLKRYDEEEALSFFKLPVETPARMDESDDPDFYDLLFVDRDE